MFYQNKDQFKFCLEIFLLNFFLLCTHLFFFSLLFLLFFFLFSPRLLSVFLIFFHISANFHVFCYVLFLLYPNLPSSNSCGSICLVIYPSLFPSHSSFSKYFTAMEVKRLSNEDNCSKTDPSFLCDCAIFYSVRNLGPTKLLSNSFFSKMPQQTCLILQFIHLLVKDYILLGFLYVSISCFLPQNNSSTVRIYRLFNGTNSKSFWCITNTLTISKTVRFYGLTYLQLPECISFSPAYKKENKKKKQGKTK